MCRAADQRSRRACETGGLYRRCPVTLAVLSETSGLIGASVLLTVQTEITESVGVPGARKTRETFLDVSESGDAPAPDRSCRRSMESSGRFNRVKAIARVQVNFSVLGLAYLFRMGQ